MPLQTFKIGVGRSIANVLEEAILLSQGDAAQDLTDLFHVSVLF